MEPQKKKAVILAALLGVLVLLWGYNFFFSGRPAGVETAKRAVRAKAETTIPGRPIKVDLELLKAPAEKYSAKRNIFNPVFREPELVRPKLPNAPGVGQAKALPPPPPPPPPKSPAELAEEKARKEIGKFKVLGFLKREDRTDVFLSHGDEYFMAAEGGKIKDNFVLEEIGFDYIVIADSLTGVKKELDIDLEGKDASGAADAARPGPVPAGPAGAVRGASTGGAPRPVGPRPASGRPTAQPSPAPRLPADVEDAMQGAGDDHSWPVAPGNGAGSGEGAAARPPAPLKGATLN